jgi:hypothetical protein
LGRLNPFPGQSSRQANSRISLAPGFSRVWASRKRRNRFNGFLAGRFHSRNRKPFKRLRGTTSRITGLKPDANETICRSRTTHHASSS